jgi:peptidoglycan hydrolase-like protein with peptidoglycan-binding domain
LLDGLRPPFEKDLVMKPMHSLLVAALAAAAMASASAAENLFVDAKTVAQAQKLLNDRGFRTGGVDGRMGPQTQAALVNFQRAEKLQPTGKLDKTTLMALGLQKADGAAASGSPGRYSPATIRKAQETLNARGFKAGPANGVLGDSTATALRAFQKSENLAVTGRLNPRTLRNLGIDESPASAGASRGADASSGTLREVQRKLAERGYRPGAADGVIGRSTRTALMEFQRAQNLPVTGRADRQTLASLGIGTGIARR